MEANMGDCNETLRELETFLDGELSPTLLADIRSHLGDCPNCLEAFDFHAELKAVIAAKCHSDEMPPGLLGRIEECFKTGIDPGQPPT
jgi:mycothiol system anti-sigma-R factor